MILPANFADWPAEWQELAIERASIMEFDGNQSRRTAERLAVEDVRKLAREK